MRSSRGLATGGMKKGSTVIPRLAHMSKKTDNDTAMRRSRITTVLVFALFGLPYLLDLGYCEELQAPKLWQAMFLESEEIDLNEAKTTDLVPSVSALQASIGTDDAHPWERFFSPQQTRSHQGSPCGFVPPRGPPPAA